MFHLNCLTCFLCRRELSTGDQLYIVDDNKFMCKEDYLLHKHGQHPLSGKFFQPFFSLAIFQNLFHFTNHFDSVRKKKFQTSSSFFFLIDCYTIERKSIFLKVKHSKFRVLSHIKSTDESLMKTLSQLYTTELVDSGPTTTENKKMAKKSKNLVAEAIRSSYPNKNR